MADTAQRPGWWAECMNCEITVTILSDRHDRLPDPSDEEAVYTYCNDDRAEAASWDCPYCGDSLTGWSEEWGLFYNPKTNELQDNPPEVG